MKKFLVACLLCISCTMFTGCFGVSGELDVDSNNVETWIVPEGSRFVPVDIYTVDNGKLNGLDFVTYVDLENGTMWLYSSAFCNGYGTTFTKLTDENDNACIYEDLDELRDKYNYKED